MALRITHLNKSKEDYTLQIKPHADSLEVKNIILKPEETLWVDTDFLTTSVRLFYKKELIDVVQYSKLPNDVLPMQPINYSTEEKTHKEEVVEKKSISSLLDKANKQVQDYKGSSNKEETSSKEEKTSKSASDIEADKKEESEFKSGKWDVMEEAYLKRFYPTKGAEYVANYLKRTEKSVRKKAESLGVTKKKKKSKKK